MKAGYLVDTDWAIDYLNGQDRTRGGWTIRPRLFGDFTCRSI
jgi:hypothetical protein